jgi:hypothetical protein
VISPRTIITVRLPDAAEGGKLSVVRLEVAEIEPNGSIRRRVVDTVGHTDAGDWEVLTARALAVPPPYRPVPGSPVYRLRVDDRDVLVAEHDLDGPMLDLVNAVLAEGDAVLAAPRGAQTRSRFPRAARSLTGDAMAIITGACS